MSETPPITSSQRRWDLVLILFVVTLTAAKESGLIPEGPWNTFVGIWIAGMYSWGIFKRPQQGNQQ